MSRGLKSIGFRLKEGSPFQVVEVDDYLQDRLEPLNRQALLIGNPWIPVCNTPATTWVGPVFEPGEGGCWNCLASRLRENGFKTAPLRHQIQVFTGCDPDALRRAGLVLAALLIHGMTGESPPPKKGLWTFEAGSGGFRRHEVVRREGCRSCYRRGSGPAFRRGTTKLEDRSPKTTWRKLQHHVSPVTGVVASLQPILKLRNRSLYLWQAQHAYVRRLSPEKLKTGRRGKSVGKDGTDLQAKLGALCEALERYSGLFRGDEIRIKASLRSLGEQGIHPNLCMNFSRQQYRKRDFWNRREADFNWIPRPFREDRIVEWSSLRSLTGEDRFLPTGYCYYGYRSAPELPYFRPDSNGCAAGNTLPGAVFRGLMEVVERDAVAIWWYNRLRRPAVDLESFRNPFFSAVQDFYHGLGRDLWALDLTTDVEIPVFVAISAARGERHQNFTLGFGAHLSSEIAMSRALHEMSQSIPVLLTSERQEEARVYRGQLTQREFLSPESSSRSSAADFAQSSSGDLEEDLNLSVRHLQKRGLEVLYLNQTRQDVGLHVVKVIVPGMRQIWPRFGPGRLYQLPVQLGILPVAMREDDLNGAHLMI